MAKSARLESGILNIKTHPEKQPAATLSDTGVTSAVTASISSSPLPPFERRRHH